MPQRGTPDRTLLVRLFDLLAFVGILAFAIALVVQGVGAASLASLAALVGVCGRIWVSFSRPTGAATSRRIQAKVAAGSRRWGRTWRQR